MRGCELPLSAMETIDFIIFDKEIADFDRALKPLLEDNEKQFEKILQSLAEEFKPIEIEMPEIVVDDIKPTVVIDDFNLTFEIEGGPPCNAKARPKRKQKKTSPKI